MHSSSATASDGIGEDGQRAAVALLSDAATYGLPPGAIIDRIDTHAAHVFMAGDRAYKMKRAVTYPFFDYATPTLRLDACEAELALNRRTAPDLYLGVGGLVRGTDGHVRLVEQAPVAADGGPDPSVLEYLITMRRFPQTALLDRMAMDGTLSPAIMRDLAGTIAVFHDTAEPRPTAPGAAEMADLARTNIREMRRHAAVFDADAVERLDRATQEAVAAGAELIDRRRDAGYIRHCHGDLHLRNIVMLEGRPVPFDCVEFGDRIAVIDVLYDLAFLLMDMEHRRLRGLANILFNHYLDLTGDLAGLALMPLFMSVRAGIRAHLTAAAAAAQADPDTAAALRTEAATYLALASRLLHPAPPVLVAIGGLSGTGKTTLARALAPTLGPAPGAVILRSDVLRKWLAGVDALAPLPESFYSPEHAARTYAELAGRAGLVLDGHHSVICDAVYAQPGQRQMVEDVARAAGVAFTGLWLVADQDVALARVARRRGDASDATAAVVRRQAAYDLGDMRWEVIPASGNAQETTAIARRHIAR